MMLLFSRLFATPSTVAYQAPLFMEFYREEYWIMLSFPSPWDLPDLEISEPPGKHHMVEYINRYC